MAILVQSTYTSSLLMEFIADMRYDFPVKQEVFVKHYVLNMAAKTQMNRLVIGNLYPKYKSPT